MSRLLMLFALAVIFLAGSCTSPAKEEGAPSSAPSVPEAPSPDAEDFEEAIARFEQNATDGDVEVVFEIKGGDAGLSRLQVLAPDGRIVVDFTAPDPSTMGIRSFRMESPEPQDIPALKKAYPEGTYRFVATDSEGTEFRSEAGLSHTLPGTVSFVNPEPEAEGVPVGGLEITWSGVEGVAAYLLEIEVEDDELVENLSATLPGSVTSFPVPERFLRPGMEYKVAIGTESQGGNLSFVETTFATAGGE